MRDPEAGFHRALNRHGYGFHYAVLRLAESLYDARRSRWVLEAAEFPVEVQGAGTRIDFVLRHRDKPHYLVAECKRANPALADWCFVRAPYVRRGRTDERIFAEHLTSVDAGEVRAGAKPIAYSAEAFQVALEVRTEAEGEGATGRGAIEEAATQVCRGMNGLVEFFARRPEVMRGEGEIVLSPVVFTTANLLASNADLSQADLVTGNLERDHIHLLPKAYVMYQYHQSQGIKHARASFSTPRELGDVLDAEFIRSVHFVGTSGIESFLTFMSETIA